MATTNNSAYLEDDGTMDTIIRCGKCGHATRFNFDFAPDDDEISGVGAYDDFVVECIGA